MRKGIRFSLLLFAAVCFSITGIAQSVKINGSVRDNATQQTVPSVSITVKGSPQGTYSDAAGNFELTVPKLPVTLVISSIGFEKQEIVVSTQTAVAISLLPASTLGQEVVVSASRTPERILESPVTIERVSSAAIRNAPAASYYDVLANVKGVDLATSSLTFKTPSTRGFTGSGNLRFNQLVDGMDNQAPGLNFSVGGIIGVSELDVESMELLPGASSALYGPGGMNGTLLINSKNPFRSQGLSVQIKQGIMHIADDQRKPSPYYNWNFRYAKAIGEKFAFKISTDLIHARDWLAQDYRNYKRLGTTGDIVPGTRQSDPNYDGVNVYGDETTADIRAVFQGVAAAAPFLAPYIASISGQPVNVSRTGYEERDVVSPNTVNFRGSGALHYKITPGIEASLAAYIGTGNTVYTGSDRYSLKELKIAQYKFELNSRNWFFRAYTTQEDAGESFNATVTTRLLNEAWKPSTGSTGWFAQYGQAFLASKLTGANDADAHAAARATADIGRPAPGSAQFKQIFDKVRSIPISNGGGLFLDKTDLYNVEGQYNLSEITKGFADILVGANFKKYVLNSEGTLFADSTGTIGINEFGAYVQASRQIVDRLKITLAGRYDKNENFEGRFTPRATALFKVSENNNIRLSYQSAYRFPSTQQQWIDLTVAGGVQLIGGVQDLKDFYNFSSNPVYSLGSVQTNDPKVFTTNALRPESVRSFELGYKGLIANKLLIDVYGYKGQYTDFIVRNLVVQSKTGNRADLVNPANQQVYSVPGNSETKV
ncbi:MAG TPA: TonB-dependent receptor, partial [Flavisolibacter sp.]